MSLIQRAMERDKPAPPAPQGAAGQATAGDAASVAATAAPPAPAARGATASALCTAATRPAPAEPPAECDVFVIGGGPAGSTIAALLAAEGRDVVLAEKARHPRFHIGESLLPANVALFEQLGVREQVEAIGLPKHGVEFVSPDHDAPSRLQFADAWDKSMPHSWQVRRSDLDALLFRNAAARGAKTLEGCRVQTVDLDGEGAHVEAQLDDGTRRSWHAHFVVDASGRDTLLASKLGAKRKDPRFASAALFGHFANAERLPGPEEGDISILWFEHGWFWFIPLPDGTTSVGAVCSPDYLEACDKPLAEFFADTIALAPGLAERLTNAKLVDGKVHATGSYSYASTHCTGERHLLVGDAYAFIDPVFSSGVYLAMHNAFQGAQLVATTLDRPEEAEPARRRYEADARKGLDELSWFTSRLTDPAMREMLMAPRRVFRGKEALLSLLSGDIHGRTSLRKLKALYYLGSVSHPRRTLAAWRRRRENVREAGALTGENVVETR